MSDEIVKSLGEIMRQVMETRGVLAELHDEYGTETALIVGDAFARYLENLAADWRNASASKEYQAFGTKS